MLIIAIIIIYKTAQELHIFFQSNGTFMEDGTHTHTHTCSDSCMHAHTQTHTQVIIHKLYVYLNF